MGSFLLRVGVFGADAILGRLGSATLRQRVPHNREAGPLDAPFHRKGAEAPQSAGLPTHMYTSPIFHITVRGLLRCKTQYRASVSAVFSLHLQEAGLKASIVIGLLQHQHSQDASKGLGNTNCHLEFNRRAVSRIHLVVVSILRRLLRKRTDNGVKVSSDLEEG